MKILPVIVVSQFFCTSLWFAGNAVMGDLAQQLSVAPDFLGHIISVVQLGFIAGTFVFALLSIADRYSPSRVFFLSAFIASIINLGIVLPGVTTQHLLVSRFATGFLLAGIYPVGMKIVSDHYREGLGKSLGFLVGALVLGTALPHLLKATSTVLPWQYVIYGTSALAVAGGMAVLLLVPDGRYRQTTSRFQISSFIRSIGNRQFNSAALGYFGHMWELYAFWVFVPVMLTTYNSYHPYADINVPLLSFLIIAAGAPACVFAGILSQIFGAKRIAFIALSFSCACCLSSPLFLMHESIVVFIIFLLLWGSTVVADSPLFSTLVAGHAPAMTKGTALTSVTCIGFFITIISIQFLNMLLNMENAYYIYTLLAIGPMLGLAVLSRK